MTNRPYLIDLYQGDDVIGDHDEGFAKTKAYGIAFLDHKASQGTQERDRMCALRRSAWMDGVPVTVTDVDGSVLKITPRFGFYHFNGGGTPASEAANFMGAVKSAGYQEGDDLCIDWEGIGASGYQVPADQIDAFCQDVEDWCGFPIKVYGGNVPREQFDNHQWSSAIKDRFTKRRLWFCSYGAQMARLPRPWIGVGTYAWQDDGDQYGPGPHIIPGIERYCDNSTIVGTMTVARLTELWGKTIAMPGALHVATRN